MHGTDYLRKSISTEPIIAQIDINKIDYLHN